MCDDLEAKLSLNTKRYVNLCQKPNIDIEDMAFLQNFRVLQKLVLLQRYTENVRLPDG